MTDAAAATGIVVACLYLVVMCYLDTFHVEAWRESCSLVSAAFRHRLLYPFIKYIQLLVFFPNFLEIWLLHPHIPGPSFCSECSRSTATTSRERGS